MNLFVFHFIENSDDFLKDFLISLWSTAVVKDWRLIVIIVAIVRKRFLMRRSFLQTCSNFQYFSISYALTTISLETLDEVNLKIFFDFIKFWSFEAKTQAIKIAEDKRKRKKANWWWKKRENDHWKKNFLQKKEIVSFFEFSLSNSWST